MNKKLKRVVAGALIAACSCGAVVGGLYTYKNVNASPVSVYPVNEIGYSAEDFFYLDSDSATGSVVADNVQSVYLSDTQTVKEVLVEQGQTVKKGDALLTYDTTLTEIQIEKAQNTLDEENLALSKAEAALQKINRLTPSSGIEYGYVSADPSVTEEPTPTPTPELAPEYSPIYISGSGDSPDDPYVYFWGSSDPLSDDLLNQMFDGVSAPVETSETDSGESEVSETSDGGENTAGTGFILSRLFGLYNVFASTTEEVPGETEVTDYGEVEIPDDPDITVEPVDPAEAPTASPQNPDESVADPTPTPEEISATPTPAPVYSAGTKYIRLEIHEGDNISGAVLYSWNMIVARNESGKLRVVPYNPDAYSIDSSSDSLTDSFGTDEGGDDGTDYGSIDYGSGDDLTGLTADASGTTDDDYSGSYTASEIAQMKTEKEKEIRDTTITAKLQEISLNQMKEEFSGDTIYAKADGVISVLNDPDEASAGSGSPVLTISGEGGYYVTVGVNELKLPEIRIGEAVSAESWSGSGAVYSGTVVEVDDYPSSSLDSWGMGNPNVSYYPCKIELDGSEGVLEDDYVNVSFEESGDGTSDGGFYLDKMYVRNEGTNHYVYVRGSDGRLEKRYVVTGKLLDSSTIEIRSGITMDDYIAFPYGSDVSDGAKTEEGSVENLYNY